VKKTNEQDSGAQQKHSQPPFALQSGKDASTSRQQAIAKNHAAISQAVFENPQLRKKAFYSDESCIIFHANACAALGWLKDARMLVDCIVTSPPFYGQRDYGVEGQIGLELTPYDYINNLVTAFNATCDVLQTTGSLWINLGDTYWNGRGEHKGKDHKQQARRFGLRPQDRPGDGKLCKNKQLLLIPHRFAIEMQERDWIVRNDNVWVKPNPIPDQVVDRCSMSHEYVFQFVKQRFYYFSRKSIGRKSVKGNDMPPLDTWDVPISKGRTKHKATFSEELVRIPILATTPPG
jgi:site-specific DNA-methyltransferase (cytosine-N4-specific)